MVINQKTPSRYSRVILHPRIANLEQLFIEQASCGYKTNFLQHSFSSSWPQGKCTCSLARLIIAHLLKKFLVESAPGGINFSRIAVLVPQKIAQKHIYFLDAALAGQNIQTKKLGSI
jgi:hypothetical protein